MSKTSCKEIARDQIGLKSKNTQERWCSLLVTEESVEFDDELIFLLGEISTFEVGAEIVDPPETATLTATEKTSGFWERAPASLTVSSNISYQPLIFFFAPCSFVYETFLTARGPSHIDQFFLYLMITHLLH